MGEQDWAALGVAARERRNELGLSLRVIAEALADQGVVIDRSMVSRWESGEKIAEPHYVFALERCLQMKPGSLSRLAGYLPLDAMPVVTLEDAVGQDDRLRPADRRLVLAYIQGLIDSRQAGRGRS